MVWDAEIAHDVVVQAHGEVSGTDRSYARMKIARIWQRAAAPVLFAKVELRRSPNPACDEPAEAKGELDVDGHVVRAEATAATFFEAIDRLDARLRRQLVRLADRDEVHHRRSRSVVHERSGGRTVSSGQGLACVSDAATLPSVIRASPVRPWVLSATSDAGRVRASSRIAPTG